MKYISLFEDFSKHLKRDTYMFRDMYEDENGNIIGVCKFCEEKFGIEEAVDVAEHTNNCPALKHL